MVATLPLPELSATSIPYWSVYAAAILLIAWGAILCVWGFRLFRVMLAVYGFMFGAAALGMAGQTLGGGLGAAIGAIVGGVAGAILSYYFMYIWVFMMGAALGMGIMMGAGATGEWWLWLLTFAVALLFGILALRHVRALIVVLTSVSGAGQIVWGVLLVLGVEVTQELLATSEKPAEVSALFAKYHLAVIVWFAISVLAAAWQYAMSCRQEATVRAQESERKQKMSELPRTGSPLPPQAMQALYEGRLVAPGPKTHVPYIRIALGAVYCLLLIWGGYYEYQVHQLLTQASAQQNAGELTEARQTYVQIIEEYPLSYGFIDARQSLLEVSQRLAIAAETAEPRSTIAETIKGGPKVTQLVTRIRYWLPLFACAGAGLAAMGVFLTRLKHPFTAIIAGITAGAASFGVLLQLQAYDIKVLAPLQPISEAALENPHGLYISAYALMFVAALLTLTRPGRRQKRRHA
jgi:hypothetical protein